MRRAKCEGEVRRAKLRVKSRGVQEQPPTPPASGSRLPTQGARAANQRPKLLVMLRREIRLPHYSRRTEQAYTGWVRRFVRFNGYVHPEQLGVPAVRTFLSDLATRHRVSASTQNQARAALLFLYREVMRVPLPVVELVAPAKTPPKMPVVLSPN